MTPLPKAGKYFWPLLQSCQDGRRHFIGLLVLFDSLRSVLDVGRKGCWRSEAAALAKAARMALKTQNGNMFSFDIMSVSPDYRGFKEMVLEISKLFFS